ncbi:polysaccharide biosynthesis/export family protein [Chelativorans sp. YIM 93263]|uniref:polysaccharide biosynthesis/export family protein n=1 Tax=Chelativorans sp. YIM 93263 TaxID=2906648 RepID=UPI002377E21F|nr:polysaccharide biosynthesis/export family protein [Chelativorans sp. YIM 93263]
MKLLVRSRLFRNAASLTMVAALGGMLVVSPAAAQSDEAYRVSSGDVLSIVVYGEAALSGDYPVAPDGTIAYPLLGNVSVKGLNPIEVGRKIDSALSEYVPGATVTTSVAEYAPIFLIGDVENPGEYQYRPGMIAIELVALGGGVRRGSSATDNAQLQLISARQEYADLALQIFALEARRARLQAEFEGRDYTYTPPTDSEPAVREARQRLIEGEKTLFEIRQATLASEDEALAAQEQSYQDEIEQLTESIELHSNEIELLGQDVASNRDLAERGLTAKSNLREVERRLSSARRDALELHSYLARARQNQLAFRQRRQALVETRRNEAAAEIQEIDLNLARMRSSQRSVLDTVAETALITNGPEKPIVSYELLRRAEGDYQELDASERDSILPGDVLRVELTNPMPSGEAETTGSLQDTAEEAVSAAIRQR